MIWLPVWVGPSLGASYSEADPFSGLQQRLMDDGWDRALVQTIYSRPEIRFDREGIKSYSSHREATLDYGQFLAEPSIDQAVAYAKRHQRVLKEAERQYGVEGEIVTAILLLESRLGTFIGKHYVLNILSSLAILNERAKRDMLWRGHVRSEDWESKKQFDAWALRKSIWAYGELKAYLQHIQAQGLDPFYARGSYAGALGFAQFIPSSVLKYGRDGNGDGQVDLFQHVDAIASVAHYLDQHGWGLGMERDEAFRILLSYNHSRYYADTVLKVAESVCKGKKAPRP